MVNCFKCYIYNNCGWACNTECDDEGNPKEACFSFEPLIEEQEKSDKE
jgi:hypothetical protein